VSASLLLEDSPALADIVDVEAFREVCKSFSELFGIGVKVFDQNGKKLADVRASTGDHCGYLFSVHPTQVMCTNLVTQIRSMPLEARVVPTTIDCFSGLRYQVLPVVYDGSLLGRVIFGPYRPPDLREPPATLAAHAQSGLDLERLGGYLSAVPAAGEAAVDRILVSVRNVLDVIVHNSFKMHMTSKVHIASIKGAFSDLERTNKALKHANERLQELDRLKSNFIATVSHELRTPLTSVIGYSEMLLEGLAGTLNAEQREYVSTILEKGESLLALIGQILDLARIESGNITLNKELVDPREIVRLGLSDVAPQARKRGLDLKLEVIGEVPPIRVDVDKVRRVITNLLGNAVKFSHEHGRISVLLDITEDNSPSGRYDLFEPERNRYLRIRVADQGIGIPVEKLEHIFEAFFQVDSSSTREFGGTGLGLAIVRNFVQIHGGKVEVESRTGEGSTFTVRLPYVTEKPMQAEVDGIVATAH
jgi:signal transduction histidine kinase